MKFDGAEVKEVKFGEIKVFTRFFTDNGEGYAKTSESTCIDDYSQRPINITSDTVVWIKK